MKHQGFNNCSIHTQLSPNRPSHQSLVVYYIESLPSRQVRVLYPYFLQIRQITELVRQCSVDSIALEMEFSKCVK